jgi:catechol 2,3-dioxygenase-like lactoylglutathione lyase family enzyme
VPATDGFDHVATLTTDLDRFTRWYGEVFDARVTMEMAATDEQPRMAIVDVGGGAALNVFEVTEDQLIGDRRRIGGRGAIDHFGLSVPDRSTLDGLRDRLVRAGADVGDVQRLGDAWSLFFRDVDGMELEVCAPAE